MKHERIDTFFLFLAAVAIFSLGFLAGDIAEKLQIAKAPDIVLAGKNLGETVPVFTVSEVSKSGIKGIATGGEMRLVAGEEISVSTGSGEIFLPLAQGQWRDVSIVIPDGARFVASKKGKKVYPVESKSAEKLSAENRIYFSTKEEAKQAGYHL